MQKPMLGTTYSIPSKGDVIDVLKSLNDDFHSPKLAMEQRLGMTMKILENTTKKA